jgi:predicted DNA-binding transcriptional regulator AlpA
VLPDKIIRESELKQYDGLAHSWRWECVEKGTYPRPIKLSEGGRFKGWLSSHIVAWQRWRAARADGTAGPKSSWRDFLGKAGEQASPAPTTPPPVAKPRTR